MALTRFVLAALIAFSSSAEARGSRGYSYHTSRPYYGGGHHTASHGGYYVGGSGSSHRGGHYRNALSSNHYGRHK